MQFGSLHVRISLQARPVAVTADEGDFLNLILGCEHAAYSFVPKDVERHVHESETPLAAVALVETAAKQATPPGTLDTVRARLSDLKGVFVQWRYVYERAQGPEVKVEPSIWAVRVLHAACLATGKA